MVWVSCRLLWIAKLPMIVRKATVGTSSGFGIAMIER